MRRVQGVETQFNNVVSNVSYQYLGSPLVSAPGRELPIQEYGDCAGQWQGHDLPTTQQLGHLPSL